MTDRDTERKKAAQTQTESEAATRAHAAGVQAQSKSVFEKQMNPQFYDRFTTSSIEDSEEWAYLAESVDTWLADDHVLSNRRQVWRQQAQMLNPVRAELEIAGRDPGVRLREKPLLYALANGEHPELDEAIPLSAGGQSSVADEILSKEPITSDEKTALDDIADIVTARMAMGVDSAGTDALTKAQSEQITRNEDTSDDSGRLASLGGMFD